jgi:hypothetical protein
MGIAVFFFFLLFTYRYISIFDIGIRRWWVVSFISRPIYPRYYIGCHVHSRADLGSVVKKVKLVPVLTSVYHSILRRNIAWACLRAGRWREHLDWRGMKRQEVAESCITFIAYVYLSNIPAIATENLLVLLLFSLFTTCFGPFRWNTITSLTYLEKAIDITTDPLFHNFSYYG